MTTLTQRKKYEKRLLEVTGLPTAAGREFRVIQWVKRWVARRPNLNVETDRVGNLVNSCKNNRIASSALQSSPVFVTAHLDHPAFVVREVFGSRELELEFRGGVLNPYFEKASIEVIDASDARHSARITGFDSSWPGNYRPGGLSRDDRGSGGLRGSARCNEGSPSGGSDQRTLFQARPDP